ncbi:patatin-like phospholipase family protein [Variovorax saccharolyticus]|uniref:patatin-like phospholipase family protein n=1 Tax=Variovorax saccharolyticus TaxID=3053516 RepID=UPI002576C863|nr:MULTISPECIES: patatin-like phospholipase family protein [unclassified Variovorax]MDM0017348.1 patatin-like phospholipase family protein [Variovorax sp. J22R187]MDM0026868.1 patatin-like phospholipase family protein [Variovorax sp. J31P216]
MNHLIARSPVLRRMAGSLAMAMLLAGCNALAPVNPPIAKVDLDNGYRVNRLLKRTHEGVKNDPQTIFLLTFSGGGTRAAAFSYGVLEELRRTDIVVQGVQRNLLAEVDAIAGVSGGSFTALAYALYGDRLFTEYEPRFLKRDVQGTLTRRALNPLNWFNLGSGLYGRSELAADYYDEILFNGATFADLLKQPTPVTAVTGTDLSTGARFPFSQDHFDLLCSDLGTVRLARAAATSSAVPAVLSPVTYYNYGGNCGATMPAWVQDVTKPGGPERPAGRALLRYRDIQSFEDSRNRPYLHVVDGGVSDNLGLRGLLEALEELEASPNFQREVGLSSIQRIVVVVVNSRSAPATDWDRRARAPGILSQLLQSSSVPIDHFSYESVELLKDIAQRWADKRELEVAELRLSGKSRAEAEASVPKLRFDAIDVSFDAIEDPKERRYFMDLPTSFVLSEDEVDRLRALGGRLLRESPAYRELLQRIGGAPAKGAAAAQ